MRWVVVFARSAARSVRSLRASSGRREDLVDAGTIAIGIPVVRPFDAALLADEHYRWMRVRMLAKHPSHNQRRTDTL